MVLSLVLSEKLCVEQLAQCRADSKHLIKVKACCARFGSTCTGIEWYREDEHGPSKGDVQIREAFPVLQIKVNTLRWSTPVPSAVGKAPPNLHPSLPLAEPGTEHGTSYMVVSNGMQLCREIQKNTTSPGELTTPSWLVNSHPSI